MNSWYNLHKAFADGQQKRFDPNLPQHPFGPHDD